MTELPTEKPIQNPYELTHLLDGTSLSVRHNLVDIIERELLGPKFGEQELLPFSPLSQYLVGLIAPVKLAEQDSPEVPGVADDADLVVVRDDASSRAAQRGVPVEAADENEAETTDDDPDDRTPKQGLMVPASMGLRWPHLGALTSRLRLAKSIRRVAQFAITSALQFRYPRRYAFLTLQRVQR